MPLTEFTLKMPLLFSSFGFEPYLGIVKTTALRMDCGILQAILTS